MQRNEPFHREPGKLRRIFDQVAVLPPAQRHATLARLTGEDAALRSQLERMLLAADRPPPIMRDPGALARNHMVQFADVESGDRLGDYELLDFIKEGSFGMVWRARQHAPFERLVALKVLKAGMDSQRILRRFERERSALALMSHPHIARVFDAGTTRQGRPFFAMELVNGSSITEYCKGHCLDLYGRLALFEQVCRAVHHAHEQGFVHRDLKPDNVLVETCDGEPFAKVIDFGIAKVLGGRSASDTLLQDGGLLLGSIGYMSPEQVESPSSVDPRSDVYSLGAILFELVTGSRLVNPRAWQDKGPLQYIEWMRTFEPPRPSSRRRRLARADRTHSADLDRVVGRALARHRGERYTTSAEFADDLARLRAGTPLPAKGASRRRRLRQRTMGLRAFSLGAALLTVLVAGGLATSGRPGAASTQAAEAQQEEVEHAPLLTELTRGSWHYRDSLYPPGELVNFRRLGEDHGVFHHQWNWTFEVVDEQSIGVDFWNGGASTDLVLTFDPERTRATGAFVDERSRRHEVILRR